MWFRQAADQKLPEAQYNLALAYEVGRGLSRDDEQAVRWYRLAADQRYPLACYNLGLMSEEGRGVERNDAQAAALYRTAAEQNYGPAQNNLGIMIAEGRGDLSPDLAESYAWLSLAVENGAKPTARDIISRRLTEVQLADARVKLVTLRNRLGLPVSNTGVAAAPMVSVSLPVPAAVVSPVATSDSALSDRVVKLEADVASAREANAQLLDDSRRLAIEKSALEKKLADQATDAAAAGGNLAGQLQFARDAVAKLTTENLQLKSGSAPSASSVTDVTSGGDSAKLRQTLADTEARLRSLGEDNKRLNNEVKRSIFEMGSLRHELDVLRSRGDAQPSDVAAAVASKRIADLEQSVAALRTANDKLLADSKNLADATVTDSDATRLKRQLADLQVANERLSAGLDEARTAVAQAKVSDAKVQELNKQLEAVSAELAKARVQLAAAVMPAADNQQLAALTKQVERAQVEKRELSDELAASWKETENLKASLKTQLADANQRAASAQTPLVAKEVANELAALRATVSKAEADRAALQSKLDQAADNLNAAQRAQHLAESEVASLKAASSTRDQANADLRASQEQLISDNARLAAAARVQGDNVATLRAQLATAEQNLAAARKQAEDRAAAEQQTAGEKTALQTAIDRLTSDNKQLAEVAAKPSSDVERLGKQIAELQGALASSTTQQQTQQAKVDQLAVQLAAAEKKLVEASGQATSEKNTLQNLIAQLTRDNKRLAEEATQPKDDVVRLTAQVDQLKTAMAAAATERQIEQAKAGETSVQLADAQKKLAEANGQAVTDKSTLQRLVDQLAGYNQRLTQESVQAKSDAEHLGKQVAELKNAVNAAVTEQKTQQAKAEQLASQLAATNKILEDKQQSLDAVNAKIEDLNKAVAEGQKSAEEAARLRNLSETLKQDMNALQYALKTDREKSAAALEAVNGQLKRVREANRALAEANKALINTQAAQ